MHFELSDERHMSDDVLRASATLVQLRDTNQMNGVTQNGTDASATKQMLTMCSSKSYSSADLELASSLIYLSTCPSSRTVRCSIEPLEISNDGKLPQNYAAECKYQTLRPTVARQSSQFADIPSASDLASRAAQSPPGRSLFTPKILESSLAVPPLKLLPPVSELPCKNGSLFNARTEYEKLRTEATRQRNKLDRKAAITGCKRSPPSKCQKKSVKTRSPTSVAGHLGSGQPEKCEAFLASEQNPKSGDHYSGGAAAGASDSQTSPAPSRKQVRFDTIVDVAVSSRKNGAARSTRSQKMALAQPLGAEERTQLGYLKF